MKPLHNRLLQVTSSDDLAVRAWSADPTGVLAFIVRSARRFLPHVLQGFLKHAPCRPCIKMMDDEL